MNASGEIEKFAMRLATLREGAGSPSYRSMARTSGCISHATLHEAARGSRFPSWETVEQFVSVCHGDLEHWRADWERTAELVGASAPTPLAEKSAAPADVAVARDAGEAPEASGSAGDPRLGEEGDEPPGRDASRADVGTSTGSGGPGAPGASRARHPATVLFVVGLALGVLLGAVGSRLVPGLGGEVGAAIGVNASEEPATRSDGGGARDASQFVEDITLPDGDVVEAGSTVTKTWRLRNAGEVDWTGRYLARAAESEEDPCVTPARVIVPETRPGDLVDISVEVQVRPDAGPCRVEWKMVDASGEETIPGSRPLFFEIVAE